VDESTCSSSMPDGDILLLYDTANYEQTHLTKDILRAVDYLIANLEIQMRISSTARPWGLSCQTVELTVVETEPGLKKRDSIT